MLEDIESLGIPSITNQFWRKLILFSFKKSMQIFCWLNNLKYNIFTKYTKYNIQNTH